MNKRWRLAKYRDLAQTISSVLDGHRKAQRDESKNDRVWTNRWRWVEGILAIVAISAFVIAIWTFADQRKAFELQQHEFSRQSVLYQEQLKVNKQTLIALSWEAIRNARGTAKTKADKGQIEAIQTLAALTPKGLRAADLSDLYLEGLDLGSLPNKSDIDLRGAKFCGSIMNNANLSSIDMREADLTGANLSGADLTNTDIREAKLICTAFDHWASYFDDDPFDEEPVLHRSAVCKTWMSDREKSFINTLQISWNEQSEGYRSTSRFEISWDEWQRATSKNADTTPAKGWRSWKGSPGSCCGPKVEFHPTSIPPRDLSWRPRAADNPTEWEVAVVEQGGIKTHTVWNSGRRPFVDIALSQLTTSKMGFDPCRPLFKAD